MGNYLSVKVGNIKPVLTTDATLRKVIKAHEKRLNVHDRLIQQAFEIVKKVPDPAPMLVKSEYSPDSKVAFQYLHSYILYKETICR